MPKSNSKRISAQREATSQELERQIGRTRKSVADTVDEIKETAEQHYDSAKEAVVSVLDYRQQFQKEPVVWSLGALSAGFALGYTLGYSHKVTKRGKQSQIGEFADGVVDELSKVGQNVVMPALNEKITELFGFDFRALLQQMRGNKKSKMPRRRSSASKRRSKKRQPHLR